MALGYQNPFYLKQAQHKQQSLYNGKVLLEKYDPPVVYDSDETLELAQESCLKIKQLNKELKPANYTKINHLSGVFVSQMAKSREELYFSNTSKTANVSKSISIPNEELSDDTTPKAAKFVRDFQSLAKEADESLAKHKALELEIKRLLRAVVSQYITSVVQNNSVVDTSNLKTKLERTKERFENCIIKKENEYAKLWNDWYKKCEECKYDKISYDNAYNDMQQKFERLQAQLGDLKGKSKDTPCVSNTLDPLSQKLENENVELEYQDTTFRTSENTKFAKQSILGKPPSSSRPKLYDVSPLPKSTALPKVGKSNALSKPVTSNSVPSSRESTVVNNERVIAPGIFRINPFKATRVDNFVPNKHVKTSVRTKPIIVSQPHVITKNDVNSKTNGFSPKDIRSTTRTRRPKPWNNPKSDKVPFKSKSGCLSNKLEKIEENHRSLQSSHYPNHTSSECNNIKLAIRNEKSEVICATCKQCLITANHDDCVLQYVNGMKSRKKNQSANVSKSANQKKHKAQVWKPKNVGSKERFASPKPSKPRSCLRRFPNSIFSMTCGQNWFDTLLIPLLSEYKSKDKEDHGDNECDHLMSFQKCWKVYSVICLTNYSNGENQVVSKTSAVTTADASDKRQQQQDSTSSTSTLTTTISADGNFDFTIFQDEVNKAAGKQLRSSPMMSNFSPFVSPSTTISVPHELNSIDVAATFGVPLTNVGNLHKLINDIEAGKRDELLSGLTNADHMETLDALGSICNSIQANRNNSYVTPCKVSHADDSIKINVDESTIPSDTIVQSVNINTKLISYAGAAGASIKDQTNVNSNFCTLVTDPVFDGVNVFIPRKVIKKVSTLFEYTLYGYFTGKRMPFPMVEYYARNNWVKHRLKRIMMNSKGFFSLNLILGLDGISLIAMFIGKLVMLYSYTSSMCNESWGRSSFARCLIEVNSEADLVDVVTIGIPSLSGDGFTKETIRVEYEWRLPRYDICKIFDHVHDYCPKKVTSPPIVTTSNVATPTVEKTNDGFQMVGKKKRKGKSKSTNGGQFTGPLVKHNVRYEPKETTTAPKKGATYVGNTPQSSSMLKTTGNSSKKDNLSMSNSFSALNDEEDVENVHDESRNLIHNTNAGGSSSFTATADSIPAFALEDNEHLLRHFVEIVFQFVVALRLANTKNLQDSMLGPPDAGPNYPKLLEDFLLKKSQGFDVNVEEVVELSHIVNIYLYPEEGKEISKAYDLLQTFKRLFVHVILTFEDRDSSQSYFRHLKSSNAFRIVEI
ncbi:hypothetical protein Tco_0445294 [Tanacetum coccineum]